MGEVEDGIIPIIFFNLVVINEGNLIFNYREESCEDEEVLLFQIADFESASINDGDVYNLCTFHLDGNISLSNVSWESNKTCGFQSETQYYLALYTS